MSRNLTLCASILMLALVATGPVLAEAPVQIDQTQGEAVLLDLDQAEEPLMTPAEEPKDPDLLGLEDAMRVNRIEACEPGDPFCPPGCHCLIIRGEKRCFC